jgi:hypothetical protein
VASGIYLKGLRKTTKKLSQDSRSQDRNLNPGPPKYEAGVLVNHSTTTFGETVLFFAAYKHYFVEIQRLFTSVIKYTHSKRNTAINPVHRNYVTRLEPELAFVARVFVVYFNLFMCYLL